ncbi:MAG: tetratricopeptide repeat protein [Mucilaginibacter sp.]|nr:tetratricopeptide repeat protein [Mucilaginibacter sp.]
MKIISKIAAVGLGLVFMGSSVFAQSLADAKKAIDAEQLQKAKSMLKNLVVTQSTKDENYFYLGWVYIEQQYPDSAKTVFQKGLAVNPKSALNLAGLGIVARLDKDQSGATSNFNQALALAGKDSKPYVYIAKGYLLPESNGKVLPANATAALAVLTKGNAASAVKGKDKNVAPSSNDPELFITMGEADRLLLKSDDAYTNFSNALALDPKSPGANVALGVLWKYADNFEDAEKQFQAALAIDPNYGPAYREWAETDLRWAQSVPAKASEKVKEAADQYKKYISLTDYSPESQMRYADFLINAGDFKTLQQVAADIAKSSSSNLRAYRYLGYAAYENKDYPAGLTAMNTWITKADPKRVIPRDYLYMGRLQIASGQDSLGIQSLHKALDLDSTQVDVYLEIAKSNFAKKKYKEAGDAYTIYSQKSRNAKLTDHFYAGMGYYFGFTIEDAKAIKDPKAPRTDSALLVKADSAFSYVAQKAGANTPAIDYVYRARIADLHETDRNNIKGFAKPFYEKFVEAVLAKGPPSDDLTKNQLVEAYDYLGTYYEFKEKDDAKAADNFNKAKEIDPTNKQALDYFKRKSGGKSK